MQLSKHKLCALLISRVLHEILFWGNQYQTTLVYDKLNWYDDNVNN